MTSIATAPSSDILQIVDTALDDGDGLERQVAVKIGASFHMWQHISWPGTMSRGRHEAWPLALMRETLIGDALWWYCSSIESWKNRCGSAGWALVRDGKVIAWDQRKVS